MRIGIIGAGFIGRAVARLCIQHGCEVMLSNSRHPRTLSSTMVAIGCKIGTSKDAAEFGDIILLAVPFFAYRDIPADLLAGKIVLDANNYYPQRDGRIESLDDKSMTTSDLIAGHFGEAIVVKAFNAILERDIEKDSRAAGSVDRRALPIAGDDAEAKRIASELLDRLGYDVVDAGPLSEGWRFERATPAYCVAFDKAQLQKKLQEAGTAVAEGSWRS